MYAVKFTGEREMKSLAMHAPSPNPEPALLTVSESRNRARGIHQTGGCAGEPIAPQNLVHRPYCLLGAEAKSKAQFVLFET